MPTFQIEYNSFRDANRALKKIKATVKAHNLKNSYVIFDELEPLIVKGRTRWSWSQRKYITKETKIERYRIVWSYELDPERKPTGNKISGSVFRGRY